MVTKYFIKPWAVDGDKSVIPDDLQPVGTVSYDQGFPERYSLPPSDADSLATPRFKFNQLNYDITTNIQQYQQEGTPNFIASADNGGSPFSYRRGARVTYDDGVNGNRTYVSLINSNTSIPTDLTKWSLGADFPDTVIWSGATFDGTVTFTGCVVYHTGLSTFSAALADGTVKQNAIGFADINNKLVYAFGRAPIGTPIGSIPGAFSLPYIFADASVYYLSTTDAGRLTSVKPSVNAVKICERVASNVGLNYLTTYVRVSQLQNPEGKIFVTAYKTSNQTGVTTGTVIAFDGALNNVNSIFNPLDNTFTVPINGWYRLSLNAVVGDFISASNDLSVILSLRPNPSIAQRGVSVEYNERTPTIGGSEPRSGSHSAIVYCTTDKPLAVYTQLSGGLPFNCTVFSSNFSLLTSVTIEFISP